MRRLYQLRTARASVALTLVLALGPFVGAPSADTRAIEPVGGSPSMAETPVVEIGRETRPVLDRGDRRVLDLNRKVVLPAKQLVVPIELPEDLPPGRHVGIEASVSVRESTSKKIRDLREGGRIRLDAPPVFVQTSPEERATEVSMTVPDELEGRSGLLTVLAWIFPEDAAVAREVGPWTIGAGDRLEFGYGVESASWDAGSPPVRFRVFGVPEEGGEVLLFERALDPARDARDRRWFDATIGLEPLAGRTARFRFEGEALESPGVKVPRALPVFSDPRLHTAGTSGKRRSNLVLISLDTLSALHTGAYGYRRPTTPTFDRRVASAGAVVRQAVVPVPFTPPSHMTMLTGLEPCAHGVKDRDGILAPEDLLLAEILRAAGYRTAAFTEDAYVVAGAGFARGFDTYVEQRDDASSAPGFGAETFRAAEEWLERDAREPFFLFLHTYQVHQPYTPPRGYERFFANDDVPGDEREQRWKDDERAYDREIRHADDLLAGFLDTLEARGYADDTVLVVTSDHGEEFGRHQWGGHGFGLWEEAILVPLAIRAPGRIAPGTVVEPQVGLVDLVPTLLDVVGVPLPRPVQGRSFAPLLLGGDPGSFSARPIVSRATGFDVVALRQPPTKYIRTQVGEDKKEELFAIDGRGAERQLSIRRRASAADRARAALAEHERECVRYRETHPVTVGKDSLFESRPDWLINRNEIERKLRSLGYVE